VARGSCGRGRSTPVRTRHVDRIVRALKITKGTRPFAPWTGVASGGVQSDPKFGPLPAFRKTGLRARGADDRIADCA